MIYNIANGYNKCLKDDLFQVGVIGLIKAYNNYDECYNVKFSTYAYSYIDGEIRKYVRENNGIKISRDILYLSSRLDRLIELLCQKYKRMPSVKEISDEVGVLEWKISEALNIKNSIKSLDEPILSCETFTISDKIGVCDSYNLELEEVLSTLCDEERDIIKLRYFNDKSQSEVAKIIGYSQAKVSRIESKVLTKLKRYYEIE